MPEGGGVRSTRMTDTRRVTWFRAAHNGVSREVEDVVLLYYAPWCGFCAGFAHVYLSLARYFRSAKDVVFARINGFTNDLPWEFSVDNYPTIHFFPAHRKEESAVFPDHLQLNLPNLIRFVLRHGTSALKLETGLSICSRTCIKNNLASTTRNIRAIQGNVHRLKQSVALLRKSVEELHIELEEPSDPSIVSSPHMLQFKTLGEYMKSLKRKIQRREMQLASARQLHSALLGSQGPYIEKHKLTAIVKKYREYQDQLRWRAQREESHVTSEEVTVTQRDEL